LTSKEKDNEERPAELAQAFECRHEPLGRLLRLVAPIRLNPASHQGPFTCKHDDAPPHLKNKDTREFNDMTEQTPRSDPAPVTGNNNSSRLDADADEDRRKLSDKEARKRAYNSWRGFRQRSRKKREHTYDPRWDSFEVFINDVGLPAYEGDTLDRVPNTCTHYGPSTVRWATKEQQSNNRRNTIFLTYQNETLPLAEWARRTNQKPDTLRNRYSKNWSDQEIIDGKGRDATSKEPWRETPWKDWPEELQENVEVNFQRSGVKDPWHYAAYYLEYWREKYRKLDQYITHCDGCPETDHAKCYRFDPSDCDDPEFEEFLSSSMERLRQLHELYQRRRTFEDQEMELELERISEAIKARQDDMERKKRKAYIEKCLRDA
jgi:hypothetical protein